MTFFRKIKHFRRWEGMGENGGDWGRMGENGRNGGNGLTVHTKKKKLGSEETGNTRKVSELD